MLAGADEASFVGEDDCVDTVAQEMFVEYGLTPYEALETATRLPAEFHSEGGKWGTLAVGSRADMVLLGSSPLDDITATRDIDAVVLTGAWYPASELQSMLDDIATDYEAQANITMVPFTNDELTIGGVVPAGWTELDSGVWTRTDPDLDPVFLVQQAAPTSAADDLVAGLIGDFGATDVGDAVDSVELNRLTWEVFTPDAELGLIMARANASERVLVVALAAPPDQLDQLAETAFQPAVAALEDETP